MGKTVKANGREFAFFAYHLEGWVDIEIDGMVNFFVRPDEAKQLAAALVEVAEEFDGDKR